MGLLDINLGLPDVHVGLLSCTSEIIAAKARMYMLGYWLPLQESLIVSKPLPEGFLCNAEGTTCYSQDDIRPFRFHL